MKRSLRKLRLTRWRLLRRHVFDWPAIFIGVSGAGLWTLWPSVGGTTSVPRPLPAPHVTASPFPRKGDELYLSPVVFALPSSVGFRAADSDIGAPDMPMPPRVSRPHDLARERSVSRAEGGAVMRATEALSQDVGRSLQGYQVRSRAPSVFTAPREDGGEVQIIAEGALAAGGFLVTDAACREVLHTGGWEVALQVYVGAGGTVEHVFLEKGCDQPLIHEKVIRMVSRGQLAKPDGMCRGRVVVRCTRRRGPAPVADGRAAPQDM